MKLNKDKICSEAKASIDEEMNVMRYMNWIEDVEIKSIDDEKIVLITHSIEHYENIKTRFLDLLKNSLEHVLKKEYKVEVIAEPKEIYTAIRKVDAMKYAEITCLHSFIRYPIIIYGKNNTDKNYFATALYNEFKTSRNIIRISSNNFIKEIINADNTNILTKTRNKFKKLDVLIIEDIENIVGENRVQTELYYITKYFIKNNKKIIFISELNIEELQIDDKLKKLLYFGKFVETEKIKEIIKITNKK